LREQERSMELSKSERMRCRTFRSLTSALRFRSSAYPCDPPPQPLLLCSHSVKLLTQCVCPPQVGLIAVNCLGDSSVVTGHVNTASHHFSNKSQHSSKPANNGSTRNRSSGAVSDDPEVARRIERLEGIKLRLASDEEFDAAASLKGALSNVTSLAGAVRELGEKMKVAAREEDYGEAGRLKKQKEASFGAMMDALVGAEESVKVSKGVQGGKRRVK